jgi:hypothetical protein
MCCDILMYPLQLGPHTMAGHAPTNVHHLGGREVDADEDLGISVIEGPIICARRIFPQPQDQDERYPL